MTATDEGSRTARSSSTPPSQHVSPLLDSCPSCQGTGYVASSTSASHHEPCLMCPGPSLTRFVTHTDGRGSKSHSPTRDHSIPSSLRISTTPSSFPHSENTDIGSARAPSKVYISTPDRLKAKWSVASIIASLSSSVSPSSSKSPSPTTSSEKLPKESSRAGEESDIEDWGDSDNGSRSRGRKNARRRVRPVSSLFGKRKNQLLAEAAFKEVMQEMKA